VAQQFGLFRAIRTCGILHRSPPSSKLLSLYLYVYPWHNNLLAPQLAVVGFYGTACLVRNYPVFIYPWKNYLSAPQLAVVRFYSTARLMQNYGAFICMFIHDASINWFPD
jgi:hypothetical protein